MRAMSVSQAIPLRVYQTFVQSVSMSKRNVSMSPDVTESHHGSPHCHSYPSYDSTDAEFNR